MRSTLRVNGGRWDHTAPPQVIAGALALVAASGLLSIAATGAAAQREPAARNGRIVFQRYVGELQQLFTIKPDGSGIRKLTSASQTSEYGRWSPDGRRIVFDRSPLPAGGSLGTIYRMHADGSREVAITAALRAAGRFAVEPVWSPSGKQVAFRLYTIQPFSDGIWIMNADGTGLRPITRGPGQGADPAACDCDEYPDFSPDGRRIAFVRIPTDRSQATLFVVNVDGSGLRRLTAPELEAGPPRWSPDGSLIAFSSYAEPHPGKSANLFTMRPDGTHRRQLTHNRSGNGHSTFPAWSPDGRLIVFTHGDVSLPAHSPNDLYVMPARGGRARQLTHLARFDANKADWGTAR